MKTAVGDEKKEEVNDIVIDKTYPAGVDQGLWLRPDDINAEVVRVGECRCDGVSGCGEVPERLKVTGTLFPRRLSLVPRD